MNRLERKEPVDMLTCSNSRPIKIKPGRPIILTLTTPSGETATAVITPQSADGGQAARVCGAKVSYQKPLTTDAKSA